MTNTHHPPKIKAVMPEINGNFHSLSHGKVLNLLRTTKNGLTEKEVNKRVTKFGLNILAEKKGPNVLWLFFKQFNSILIYVLLVACAISFVSNHRVDAVIILIVILVNSIIGFVQELQAEKSIAALKNLVVLKAKVIRDGKLEIIDASGLVPGDIVVLEEGDKIPADGRILECKNFQTSEASLTGESFPVKKSASVLPIKTPAADQKNSVFMGTFVNMGSATVVITATGERSVLGNIASDINQPVDNRTNFQKQIHLLTKQIGGLALVLSSLIFIIGFFLREIPLFEIFLFTLASLVSAIPEGLPAVLTIVLAIGARRMASKKAIIRNLTSTQTLGAVSVICTDKTGTLTENSMTVTEIAFVDGKIWKISGRGWDFDGKIEVPAVDKAGEAKVRILNLIGNLGVKGRVSYDAKEIKIIGDPTEAALWVLAKKTMINQENYTLVDDLPFNSVNKLRASLIENKTDGKKFLFVIGAPEVLISLSTGTYDFGQKINFKKTCLNLEQKILEYNRQAARTLGIAVKEVDHNFKLKSENIKDLKLLAITKIVDPVRQGVKQAVLSANKSGIRVIMMTGDHKETAKSIALQTGILNSKNNEVLTQTELETFDPNQLKKAVFKVNVFARLTPKMKQKITEILQSEGQYVAMTGDGVNDAPALKKADIGISMGLIGTDVAREASDMVLADDNFVSILEAVKQGRIVFNNIRRSTYYLLTTNFAESITILTTFLVGLPAPLVASQILWMNLVTDSINGIALATESESGKEISDSYQKYREPILTRSVLPFMLIIGGYMVIASILAFIFFLPQSNSKARTSVLVIMSFSQLFNMINMRSLNGTIFRKGLFSNRIANVGLILSSVLILSSIYFAPIAAALKQQSLKLPELFTLIIISTGSFWIGEFYKWNLSSRSLKKY